MELQNIVEKENEVLLEIKEQPFISTTKVLVATNGFSNKLLLDIDLKPARNLVLLTDPIPNLKLNGCYHYNQGYIYFRNVGNRVLLGGGRHWDLKEEETAAYGINQLIKERLLEFLGKVILPHTEFRIDQEWSGIMGVGPQKKPIIQKLNDQVGVAVRLGGMGVAIGCQVGKKAAAMMA